MASSSEYAAAVSEAEHNHPRGEIPLDKIKKDTDAIFADKIKREIYRKHIIDIKTEREFENLKRVALAQARSKGKNITTLPISLQLYFE